MAGNLITIYDGHHLNGVTFLWYHLIVYGEHFILASGDYNITIMVPYGAWTFLTVYRQPRQTVMVSRHAHNLALTIM